MHNGVRVCRVIEPECIGIVGVGERFGLGEGQIRHQQAGGGLQSGLIGFADKGRGEQRGDGQHHRDDEQLNEGKRASSGVFLGATIRFHIRCQSHVQPRGCFRIQGAGFKLR